MRRYDVQTDPDTGEQFLAVPLRGTSLLEHPLYNKGTAFTEQERNAFGLHGLLPPAVVPIESQLDRVYEAFHRKSTDLSRHIYLSGLHDRNETLFYRLLLTHLEELLPIVYTPTVGLACQQFSHIFRRARGVWICPEDTDRVETVLRATDFEDVRLIVVTDNERILGLGDQGVGGMGIPIGKLTLYVAAAGIHPSQVLPVSLDVGTDNPDLLEDPLYLGHRHPRLRGAPYDALVEGFVHGVRNVFPHALLQWEDFKQANAFRLLDAYREALPSFNDDIQGTAAVVHAGILTALRIKGGRFADQRICIMGAGAAGIGIARQLLAAMVAAGVPEPAARLRIVMLDSQGLLLADRPGLDPYRAPWAQERGITDGWDLADPNRITVQDVIRNWYPSVLLGLTGRPGLFSEAIVRDLAKVSAEPIVMPLSNPTSKSEAAAADLFAWTNGQALVATGSPFPPVSREGKTVRIGQGNNAFIFPGIGLGCLVAGARTVPDACFLAAAEALAACANPRQIADRCLFPELRYIRAITRAVAFAVARTAIAEGAAPHALDHDLETRLDAAAWYPAYLPYRPA